MHCVALIMRPRRAAGIVAAVGLLFGAHGVLTLRWPGATDVFGPGGRAAAWLLVLAVGASIVALGVLAPLHSRSGSLAVSIGRAGLAIALLPLTASALTNRPGWTLALVAGLVVATVGMAGLARARRHEGDLPFRLLDLTLAGTVLGIVLGSVGGCLVPGAAWLAVAVVLWSSYASPSTAGTSLPSTA
jgi:hypothetical protein